MNKSDKRFFLGGISEKDFSENIGKHKEKSKNPQKKLTKKNNEKKQVN